MIIFRLNSASSLPENSSNLDPQPGPSHISSHAPSHAPSLAQSHDNSFEDSSSELEIPLLSSTDSEDSETFGDENFKMKNAKPRRENVWVFLKSFPNITEAKGFVTSENCWSKLREHNSESGTKIFYRCNLVKKRGPQCAASLHLLFDATSEDVKVFKTEAKHNHDSLPRSGSGIGVDVKKEIKRLVNYKLKPRSIVLELAKKSLPIPSKNQLSRYLHSLKLKIKGDTKISLGELQSWLSSNTDVPEEENALFIADFSIWGSEIQDKESGFQFFVTSKKLLKFAMQSKILHADGTYKILWQGYPVIIVGTTDRGKHFHPFGLSVCTNERTEDYTFVFKTLKETIFKVSQAIYHPSTLMADAAKAIQNAFCSVFGENMKVLMCWAHAKDKMEIAVKKFVKNSKERDEIIVNIGYLQIAPTPQVFHEARALFLSKWSQHREFIAYFEMEWIQKNPNWAACIASGLPSTNNALEGFNNDLKSSHTLREKSWQMVTNL